MSSASLPIVLVTGGTGGIGGEISRELAAAGFEVWFVGRDPAKGRALEAELADRGQRGRFWPADLASQTGVVRLAEAVKAALGPQGLAGLVNNHGGVTAVRQFTPEGVEAIYAANFVHPVLLASLLLPELTRARGRVVQMSTGYHHLVKVRWGDLAGRRWDCGMNVYGRAKLLSVQAGEVIGERWRGRGVGWHFADPGMAETPLTRSMGPETFPWYGRFLMPLVKRVQRPIPLRWCATSTLRLLARRDLPAATGVYVLPGPLVLPRPLVGFDRRAGAAALDWALGCLSPAYREGVATALATDSGTGPQPTALPAGSPAPGWPTSEETLDNESYSPSR